MGARLLPRVRARAKDRGAGVARAAVWQRAGEIALAPVAPLLESALRSVWRVRLRRRACAAARPDVVLADGILKLHLSDYRRRVMDRFAARLESLRARTGTPEASGGDQTNDRDGSEPRARRPDVDRVGT